MRPLVLIASLALAACGTLNAASGGSTAPAAGVKVTMSDDGRVLTAHVGDHVQIALGDTFEWKLDPPDGAVLTRGVQNDMLVRGTQAIWSASAVGRSTVHATGTAVCPSGSACPQFAVLFIATIEVVP